MRKLLQIRVKTFCILSLSLISLGILSVIVIETAFHDEFDDYDFIIERGDVRTFEHADNEKPSDKIIPHPIILWWTYFTGEKGRVKECGHHKCFTTNDRFYLNHPNTSAVLFYGSDFNLDDLPLPKAHDWGLFHEESPKNNYLLCHEDAISIFNYTASFKRTSDVPLTTQHLVKLEDITDTQHYKHTQEKNRHRGNLSLVYYLQSDCHAPSDRDHFVEMLQRHLPVDSYGDCLHNKDLPLSLQDSLGTMSSSELYEFLSRYKFSLALENAVGDDYVTEKFWRPFIVGSLPIVFGSPKAKELLPNEKSAIFVSDFATIEDLVKKIHSINDNDDEYEQYFEHKTNSRVANEELVNMMKTRKWGVNDWNKPHFVDAFECYICEKLHENIERKQQGLDIIQHRATKEDMDCPLPQVFSDSPLGNLSLVQEQDMWSGNWKMKKDLARALKVLLEERQHFTKSDIRSKARDLRR